MEKKIQMKITMDVQGTEGFDIVITYKDTTIETVRAVQAAVAQALLGLNK